MNMPNAGVRVRFSLNDLE